MADAPDESRQAVEPDEREAVLSAARDARAAAVSLRILTTGEKNDAIVAIADRLRSARVPILEANAADVAAAREAGVEEGLVDRLALTDERLEEIVAALCVVADLPDPVGEVIRGYSLPNGLRVEQIRVPIGVVGIIYEARPNVTVDAAGLCLKSGNAVLLRGSSSAHRTNQALIDTMRAALRDRGLPEDAICQVPGTSHESVGHLMRARGLVDVLIPRGGASLINSVVEGSTVPVIETGIGNCHIYVDVFADLDKAVDIVVNAKTQRPSVCNAAETLLVHQAFAGTFLPRVARALTERGVRLHTDDRASGILAGAGIATVPASRKDWAEEYLSLDLAVAVVDDVADAVLHIRQWSSGHTEAVLSDSTRVIDEFVAGVDSAAVVVNASTRFTDGGELGFGAEIGISTQKLHARGPMALPELTTTTFVIRGTGQIRQG
ncbi:MAG: glutamate-5-semialdehyde dehydrogenase [Candidatus Nanopelagicales bacterium]|nr:glutamate-5-semialdehyde dehydrogenase [Candidatus Nanopelagicales bacterium]MDZ4250492.1 glutamate-5-semialdehyde dehydrogenase [Candidatus Nanopelagicales bacterium]